MTRMPAVIAACSAGLFSLALVSGSPVAAADVGSDQKIVVASLAADDAVARPAGEGLQLASDLPVVVRPAPRPRSKSVSRPEPLRRVAHVVPRWEPVPLPAPRRIVLFLGVAF